MTVGPDLYALAAAARVKATMRAPVPQTGPGDDDVLPHRHDQSWPISANPFFAPLRFSSQTSRWLTVT